MIYAARECVLFFTSQIRRLRFFREAPASISDMLRSAAFSGLRNAATSRRILRRRPLLKASPAAPDSRVPAQPTVKKGPAVQAKLPQTGEASWYGPQHHGKQTASGTIFDQAQLTAAHPILANGRSVEVEIADRGPIAENRIIDLSRAAAKALEMIDSGTATVRVELSSGQ